MPSKQVFDASGWDTQFRKASDALKVRPPRNYIVEKILPESSLTLVYGHSGTLKTLAVIDLFVCVALGTRWMQSDTYKGFQCEQGDVLWIDADNGIEIVEERVGAALRGHSKNEAHAERAPVHYTSFLNPAFLANEDAPIVALIERVIRWKIKLLVIDNLGMVSGGADENSSQMVQIMNRLRFIAEKTKCAVIVIHHLAKGGDDEKRKTPRGHSSIEASLDLALCIIRDDDTFKAIPTKQRSSRMDEISGLLDYETRRDSEELYRYHFEGIEPETDPLSAKAEKCARELLQKVKQANQVTLIEHLRKCGIGRNRAASEVQRMTRKNIIVLKAGARTEKLYKLSGEESRKS